MNKISFQLKAFRFEHKIKQSDLAILIGIDQSVISRLEIQGKISLSYYEKLCSVFGENECKKYINEITPQQYEHRRVRRKTMDASPAPSYEYLIQRVENLEKENIILLGIIDKIIAKKT